MTADPPISTVGDFDAILGTLITETDALIGSAIESLHG
jgi:hypothetical protein